MRFAYFAPVLLLGLLGATAARATVLDPNFSETPWVVAGTLVTGMAFAPDASDRLFLTRKTGQVEVVENGVLLSTPFATLTPIYTGSECGLIGMAFDPDFTNNGFVYFFVTVATNEQQIIRYRADGNVGVERTVILSGLPTFGINHDGGAIGFGPDGKLYWAIGDNGRALGVNADLTLLNAKVGRANRDGSVPADNPFVDGDGPNNDYVWARGFRNPFTFTFQPSTGRLWVNTVGTSYEQVFTPVAGDHAGYNTYEDNQPAGYLPPIIGYRTNGADTRLIPGSGAVRTNGVATFVVTTPHHFRVGQKVTIQGVTDTSFNGVAYVSDTPAPDQFSIPQAGPDATSGLGAAVTEVLGGCITGGTFWDSSSVPAEYQGDFFFGDYNSGSLIRAKLKSDQFVESVDIWGTGVAHAIDTAIGPDGNLYYVAHAGQVYRAEYLARQQALVVSRLHVRLLEGGAGAFHVRLAVAPEGPVQVGVALVAGDPDITLTQGASLAFDSSNWDTPQPVLLAAAVDADRVDDAATLEVRSGDLPPAHVIVQVTDEQGQASTGRPVGSAGQAGAGPTGEAGAGPGEGGSAGEVGGGAAGVSAGAAGAVGEAGASGQAGPPETPAAGDSGGCGCRVAGGPRSVAAWVALLSGCAMAWSRRRRARRSRGLD